MGIAWLNKIKSEFFIELTIILFFALEIINGIYFYVETDRFLSISFYPKIVWEIILLGFIFNSHKRVVRKELIYLIFCIGLIFLSLIRFSEDFYSLVWNTKHYNKLLIYVLVYIYLRLYRPELKRALSYFDWIILINSLLIFLGFLFQIEFLKSYPFSDRFGYSGIFCRFAINDVSLFYFIANFYTYTRYKRNENCIWLFIIVFASSFLVGTKAIILQNMILLTYILITDQKKYRIVILSSFVFSLLILLIFYNFSFWEELLKEKGILAALSSNRSELFFQRIPNAINNIKLGDFLFGFRNPFQYFTEIDLIDLFLTFGFVSGISLLCFFYKIMFQFKRSNYFAWTFILTYLLMTSISGRYTYSGMNAFYFPFYVYYLKNIEIKTY